MEKENTETNKTEILNVARKLTMLMINKDTAGLNEILDTRFTLTHITGYVQSKENGLKRLRAKG